MAKKEENKKIVSDETKEVVEKIAEGYKGKKSDGVTDETSKPSAPRKRTKKNVDW